MSIQKQSGASSRDRNPSSASNVSLGSPQTHIHASHTPSQSYQHQASKPQLIVKGGDMKKGVIHHIANKSQSQLVNDGLTHKRMAMMVKSTIMMQQQQNLKHGSTEFDVLQQPYVQTNVRWTPQQNHALLANNKRLIATSLSESQNQSRQDIV